jgi:hypothetical protein
VPRSNLLLPVSLCCQDPPRSFASIRTCISDCSNLDGPVASLIIYFVKLRVIANTSLAVKCSLVRNEIEDVTG